jgi:hypothetical protein
VALPPVSTYTVTVQMQDALSLTLKLLATTSASTPEQAISQTVVFQDVPAAAGGQATLRYNPLADPATYRLWLDLNGDGQIDMILAPNGILNQQQSADREPPVTTIALQGSRDPDGFYTGIVAVTLNASDAGKGIEVRML